MTLKEVKAALAKVPDGNGETEVVTLRSSNDDEDYNIVESIEYVRRQGLTHGQLVDAKIFIRFK